MHLWCEDHVYVDNTSPFPGKWKSLNSLWAVAVMEKFSDNRVRTMVIKCSAQSSKTQTIMCCICYAIVEDPGPAMWVVAAADEAKQFFRDRLEPTFNACKPVRDLLIKQEDMDFIFSTMPLYFTGTGAKSKLQGKPIRWLFLDEVRNYRPGRLSMVRKRTRAYRNSRHVIISTPGNKDDEFDILFKEGSQHTFHMSCPSCSQLQPLVFEQLKWDTNETTKPNGTWNTDALAKTIRYECKACGHKIRDTASERKAIARTGRFVQMNPNASEKNFSITWNAMLPHWVSFESIVMEFLSARKAIRGGDVEPMKTFVTETLGESWDDELGVIEDFGFLDDRKQDYDFDERWPEEITRFMAADKQSAGGEHYWWVIRAFGKFGKSRLISHGRCSTFLELEEIRKSHNVPVNNAVIDSGYKANEVYRFCAASGWKPFKGDDVEYYLAKDPKTEKTFRQCWSWTWAKPEGVKPTKGMQKRVRLFRFSTKWVADLTAEYMTGLTGEWTIPKCVSKDYRRQLTAERREAVESSDGYISMRWRQVLRDNHYLDCCRMINTAAVISKVISGGVTPASKERVKTGR